jgi:hypothetical protein
VITALSTILVFNLLAPPVAAACMVHLVVPLIWPYQSPAGPAMRQA